MATLLNSDDRRPMLFISRKGAQRALGAILDHGGNGRIHPASERGQHLGYTINVTRTPRSNQIKQIVEGATI